MDDRLSGICAFARESFPERVAAPVVEFGETSIRVAREVIKDVCLHLRDLAPFEMLADVSGVDFLGVNEPSERFLIAYHLYSFSLNLRLRLRAFVPTDDPRIDTVSDIWPTANWQEREIYDFFGIEFNGHPDLRRILMPDDWDGHPHRKDYPLGGTKVEYKGTLVRPPEKRGQPTSTTGYPGRIS